MTSRTPLKLLTAALTALLVAGPLAAQDLPEAVRNARAELARQQNVDVEQVDVAYLDEVRWPNPALGLPEPGQMYAQVIVPGHRVVFEVNDELYAYHTGQGQHKRAPGAEALSWNQLADRDADGPRLVTLTGDLLPGEGGYRLAEAAWNVEGETGWQRTEPAIAAEGDALAALRDRTPFVQAIGVRATGYLMPGDDGQARFVAVTAERLEQPRGASYDWNIEREPPRDDQPEQVDRGDDHRPFLVRGSAYREAGATYLPLRTLADIRRFDLKWNGETKSVRILDADRLVAELRVGERRYEVGAASAAGAAGGDYRMAAAPTIYSGRVWVPSGFAETVLGIDVQPEGNDSVRVSYDGREMSWPVDSVG